MLTDLSILALTANTTLAGLSPVASIAWGWVGDEMSHVISMIPLKSKLLQACTNISLCHHRLGGGYCILTCGSLYSLVWMEQAISTTQSPLPRINQLCI